MIDLYTSKPKGLERQLELISSKRTPKTRSDSRRTTEVAQRPLRLKEILRPTVALARASSSRDSGSFLPVPVVVELGLNNVIPPPDTIEEELFQNNSLESAASR